MMFENRIFPPLLALLLVCVAPLASADAEHRLSGFATLGIAMSDNPKLVFRRDITKDDGAYKHSGSWKSDSLLGLQWQGDWSPEWGTMVQLVAKDRFNNSLANSIEWAFVRYRPTDGLDLRLGRLGADVFMLSEYRQVGYAIPWVRPPHDLYGLASLYHFDGADVTKRIELGDAALNIKAFYGNSDEEYPTGFNNDQGIHVEFDLYGASTSMEWNYWKLRYTYAKVKVKSDHAKPLREGLAQVASIWPPATLFMSELETLDKSFDYNQIGVNYDNNDWWFQGEFLQLGSELALVASGKHAYASLGKRFGSLSIYGLAGYAEPKNPSVYVPYPSIVLPEPFQSQLDYLVAATERTLNGVRIKQRSYGVGARWDFTAKMALKIQLEQFDVDKTGTNLWLRTDNTQPILADQKPVVLSLAWDVLF
ncbi:hypothetical protein [Cellvibrio fibrivorans]|uniref:Porin n=1 Tax=Cellvibrio fibrivorans TaxID=126350 RepID=A0ABU1V166_9GAMM|nr:hypothetical protein [Cellvibrio fibrivorans]MDR7091199.1 hypothetical protein [Cellvibrio fibrivorans]